MNPAAIGFAVGALGFAATAVALALALVRSERVRGDLRVAATQAEAHGVKVAAELEAVRRDLEHASAQAVEKDARHERVIAFMRSEIAQLEEDRNAGRVVDRGSVASRLRGVLVKLEEAAAGPSAAPRDLAGLVPIGATTGGSAPPGPAGRGGPG